MTPRNVLHLRDVPEGIVRPEYAETGDAVEEAESKAQYITPQLKPSQIKVMRKACEVGRGALDAVIRAARPGVTTEELDKICHAYIRRTARIPPRSTITTSRSRAARASTRSSATAFRTDDRWSPGISSTWT